MSFELGFKQGLTHCTGAQVRLLADGGFEVCLVQLALEKQGIKIESKKQYTSGLEKIADGLQGPVALTLCGRGVLLKKVSRMEELTENSLQQVFPGFNRSEFYVQNFQSGDCSFLTVVRKELADPLISAFEKEGLKVLLFALGPFAVDHILPQLNVYQQKLDFDGHHIELNAEKHWTGYQFKKDDADGFALKIDLETIAEEFVLAYASAFQLMLSERLDLIEADHTGVQECRTEQTFKRRFEQKFKLSALLVFVLLLLNFLIFSHFHAENEKMSGKAGRQSDLYAGRQKMESELKQKESLVKKLGWNKGLKYAFICDQIGSVLPASVTLTELLVNFPENKEMGINKEAFRESGYLRLKGQAANVYAVNDCLYALKHKNWVKSVQLEKYMADEQQQTQVFTILLNF